jgi:hypothetical protein
MVAPVPLPRVDASARAQAHVRVCVNSLLHVIGALSGAGGAGSSRARGGAAESRLVGRFHRDAKKLRVVLDLRVVLPGAARQNLVEALVNLCTSTSSSSLARSDVLLQCSALELAARLLGGGRYLGCAPRFEWEPLWDLLCRFHLHPDNLPATTSSTNSVEAAAAADGDGSVQLDCPCAPKVRARHRSAVLRVVSGCRGCVRRFVVDFCVGNKPAN